MPATNKVGTQLLLSPNTRDRARALAIVRKERVAEVYRAALEGGGLRGLEKQHADALSDLHAEINASMRPDGGDKSEILAKMITRGRSTPE